MTLASFFPRNYEIHTCPLKAGKSVTPPGSKGKGIFTCSAADTRFVTINVSALLAFVKELAPPLAIAR